MDSILILIISLCVGILAAGLATICYFYVSSVKKLQKVQKENLYLRYHLQEKSIARINESKEKAMKIIQNASDQAANLLKEAQIIQTDSQHNFHDQLKALTEAQKKALLTSADAFANTFSDAIQQLEKDDIKLFQDASKRIEEVTLQEVDTYKNELAHHTIDTQKRVDEKVQAAFTKAMEEVEAYKQEKIQKINTLLVDVLSEAAQEILGKHLRLDEHKELIHASLDKMSTELRKIA